MLVKEAPGPVFIKLDQLSPCVKDQPAKAILSPIPPLHVDGLVQERCNSIAYALELRLSYTNPSMYKILQYSETPHEQPPHEQPPLLWGHIFRHHYIFLTSHLNVNPWWTATSLTWSEDSDFGSSHPWRAATQQLLEVASHGIHGWFGCGLTDIHVNHTSGQPWVHRPKACKGVDHT